MAALVYDINDKEELHMDKYYWKIYKKKKNPSKLYPNKRRKANYKVLCPEMLALSAQLARMQSNI